MANVFIEESTLTAIGNAIRSKTGKTDMILPSAMASEIAEITGGGSGSDLVKYVTFMNYDGTETLFEMPVLNGDDCKDPVSHGDISSPTKESTNAQVFTFSGGWSLTANGSKDANALKNITEDRVVYATFTASVRYYTVNFYKDVDDLHETVQVTYGANATPSSLPTKANYNFDSWDPVPENVTSDMEVFAVWTEGLSFASATWDEIASVCANGNAQNTFAVGEEKLIDINGTNVTFTIAGFNHDDLADGTGKASMSIITKNVAPIKGTRPENVWGLLDDSDSFLTNLFLSHLPTELVNNIKPIIKDCDGERSYKSSLINFGTVNKTFTLFPLSLLEIGRLYTNPTNTGENSDGYVSSYSGMKSLGNTYSLYQDSPLIQSATPYTLASDNEPVRVLTRNYVRLKGYSMVGQMIMIDTTGSCGQVNDYQVGFIFGFCI